MALFWSRKPKAEKNYEQVAQKAKVAPGKAKKVAKPAAGVNQDKQAGKLVAKAAAPVISANMTYSAGAIIRPHVTEKSGLQSQTGVYTFQVTKGATKATIATAVKVLYKVTPAKVAIVNLPAKSVFVKGRRGVVPGIRKAMITVKKGEKIDFV